MWSSPTVLVASGGLIVMNASTNRFVAGPLPPGPALPAVLRVRVLPLIVIVNDALPVTRPAVDDVNVTEQVPPEVPVAQVFADVWTVDPLESVSVTVTIVPSGTASNPPPRPRFCCAVTVKVWFSLISLTSFGAIDTRASTKRLTAGP